MRTDDATGIPADQSPASLLDFRLSARWQFVASLILLCGLAFVVHFWHLRQFGLYEDDYYFITGPLRWGPADWAARVHFNLIGMPMGRPLGYYLPELVAYLLKPWGLLPMYATGYVIFALNTCLLYVWLRRAVGLPAFALVAAMAFVVYPADTTRPFLTHALQLQTSLTFFMLAACLYFSRLRPLAYLVAACSLLTYESAFLPFLALPLLVLGTADKPESNRWRNVLLHVAICIVVVGVVFLGRSQLAESRVQEALDNLILTALKALASLGIGPVVSMGLVALRPIYALVRAIIELNAEVWTAIAASFIVLLGLCRWMNRGQEPAVPLAQQTAHRWLLIVGLIILSVSYLSAFTHFPPIRPFGRLTSVHMAGSIGASILVAWAFTMWQPKWMVGRVNGPLYRAMAWAAFMALLVGNGFWVQKDYVQSWADQRQFWRSVIELCPDVTSGTVILARKESLLDTQAIHTHSWADLITFEQLYDFPKDWPVPPRLFVVDDSWRSNVQWQDEQATWWMPSGLWPEQRSPLPAGNVILLEQVNGQLVRQAGSITLQDKPFALRPLPGPQHGMTYTTAPLWQWMIGDSH